MWVQKTHIINIRPGHILITSSWDNQPPAPWPPLVNNMPTPPPMEYLQCGVFCSWGPINVCIIIHGEWIYLQFVSERTCHYLSEPIGFESSNLLAGPPGRSGSFLWNDIYTHTSASFPSGVENDRWMRGMCLVLQLLGCKSAKGPGVQRKIIKECLCRVMLSKQIYI